MFNNLLAAAFTFFASVMVKVQPIWDRFKLWIMLALGLAIGLFLAWGPLAPAWENATPGNLRADYRSYYLAYVADDYLRTGDIEMVQKRLGLDLEKRKTIPWVHKPETLPQHIQEAIDGSGPGKHWQLSQERIIALQKLSGDIPMIIEASTTPSEETPPKSGSFSKVLIVLLLLLVLAAVGLVFIVRGRRTAKEEAEEIAATAREGEFAPVETPMFAEETEPPVKSFTTTYVLGDDYFDPSFSIEIGKDFLGECGIGISETIGTGSPKKVTAFEAWLFDKSDIRTVTIVLASEYAYNDPELRAKLDPKGEVQLLKPGMEIILETTALRVRARVKEFEYAQGNLPPNSFIQKLSVELQAWVKPGATDIEPPIPQV